MSRFGYIPKNYQTTCLSNSEGLFAYYQAAEAGFVLTCRMASGGGSGWSGVTGAKDLSQVNVAELTEIAANKALKSQKPRAISPAATPPSSSRGRRHACCRP